MPDSWTLLTKHAVVLLALSRSPESTIGEIANATGLSLRWTAQVIGDLVDAGYLRRRRAGKSYTYGVEAEMPLRQDLVRHTDVSHLTALLDAPDATSRQRDELASELRSLRHEIGSEERRLEELRGERQRLEAIVTDAREVLRSASRPGCRSRR